MRSLIRPTMFLVARLGLFFTVVAWIVGQWGAYALAAGHLVGLVDREGLLVMYGPPFSVTRLFVALSGVEAQMIREFAGVFRGFRLCGLNIEMRSPLTIVAIRHWLIVTIFVLFNGVLMWVYGKQGKELAADE